MEYNRLLVAPGNLDAFAGGLINLNNFLGNNKETLLSYRGSWLGSLRKKILKMLSQMFFAIHKDLAARVMDRTMEIADPGKMSSPHGIDSQMPLSSYVRLAEAVPGSTSLSLFIVSE